MHYAPLIRRREQRARQGGMIEVAAPWEELSVLKCDECGRAFKDISHLRLHLTAHTKERRRERPVAAGKQRPVRGGKQRRRPASQPAGGLGHAVQHRGACLARKL